MDFRTKLVSELTQLDQRESTKRGYNRFALSLYLCAANEVMSLIESGATQEGAFSVCFTPSRDMHKVARNLGLRLEVQRGQWSV